jgi:hypothetical protein
MQRIGRFAVGLYITSLTVLTMAYFVPLPETHFVRSDSGCFLYIGQQILKGHLPYRDAWDHKPPLIFYLNAAGLFLGAGSPWGVWAVAFLAILIAFWLCYTIAAGTCGRVPATFGTACMAATLVWTLEMGNLTELYALPFQLLVIYLYLKSDRPKTYAMIGAMTGLLFLLRANLIGVGVAVALLSAADLPTVGIKALSKRYLWMIAGFTVPLLLFVTYFAAHGSLTRLYEGAVGYNLEYSHSSWKGRLGSLIPAVRATSTAGVLFLAVGGVLFAAASRLQRQSPSVRRLLMIAALDLLLEIPLSCVSGKGFLHYYIPWAPALALLCAYAAYVLGTFAKTESIELSSTVQVSAGGLMLAVAIFLVNLALIHSSIQKYLWRPEEPYREAVAKYVISHTDARDKVFVWGYGPEIYVMTRRSSPTPHFFYNPVSQPRFADRAIVSQVVADISRERPPLIVDSSQAIGFNFPPLDRVGREQWAQEYKVDLSPLEPLFTLIDEEYEGVSVPSDGKWTIYGLKGARAVAPPPAKAVTLLEHTFNHGARILISAWS